MTAKRSGRVRIDLDVRTDTMTAETLMCRSINHPWQRVPTPAPRRTELLNEALVEYRMHCLRCGSTRTDLYTLPDFEPVRKSVKYAPGYLMDAKHKGSGRLGVVAARKAMYVKDDPALA